MSPKLREDLEIVLGIAAVFSVFLLAVMLR